MMFETHYGGLVNLNRAVQVFIEDNAPTEVIAVFSAQTISFFAPRGKARDRPSPYGLWNSLIGCPTAAHIITLPGDKTCLIRREEIDDSSDFLRFPNAAQRNFAHHVIDGGLRHAR